MYSHSEFDASGYFTQPSTSTSFHTVILCVGNTVIFQTHAPQNLNSQNNLKKEKSW